MAPIPILSMMDPKVGNEKLKKWASECGKEFAGLFIRLAGVFFAVAIIQLVTGNANGVDNAFTQYGPDGGATNDPVSIFVKLFIIIGALMFAKQLPQWIESVLGFKLSGDGSSFNLKKKLAGAAGLGAVAGVAGLGAKKAIAGWDSWRHGKGFWNGTKNVQGNGFISKMQKGWRDMNPNATEIRNKRREGKSEVKQMNDQWNKGVDLAQDLMAAGAGRYGSGPNAWNKVFDGSSANRKYYEAIYKDKNFIDALMRVDAADGINKEFSNAYRAIQVGGWTGPVSVGGTTYTSLTDFIDGMDTQEKILKGAQANYESIKKQCSDDAATEANYKTIKNNKINPTNANQTHASKGL